MKIDKTTAAVVTGGASGLGKASAQALAAAGARVAIFDVNVAAGEAVAKEIGGVFCKVDITSEESVVAGFEQARKAHGQERVLVHCAMTSKRGKTLTFDKETRGYKRTSTEDYAYGVNGILIASYRMASLSARRNTECCHFRSTRSLYLRASRITITRAWHLWTMKNRAWWRIWGARICSCCATTAS